MDLLATQTLSMLQSFTLAWLFFTHRVDLLTAVSLALIQGIINAMDILARHPYASRNLIAWQRKVIPWRAPPAY